LESDPSGRDSDAPVIIVKQGNEPPLFTGFFGAWDEDLFADENGNAEENGIDGNLLDIVNGSSGGNKASGGKGRFYPVETLRNNENLPREVDPTQKEVRPKVFLNVLFLLISIFISAIFE